MYVSLTQYLAFLMNLNNYITNVCFNVTVDVYHIETKWLKTSYFEIIVQFSFLNMSFEPAVVLRLTKTM